MRRVGHARAALIPRAAFRTRILSARISSDAVEERRASREAAKARALPARPAPAKANVIARDGADAVAAAAAAARQQVLDKERAWKTHVSDSNIEFQASPVSSETPVCEVSTVSLQHGECRVASELHPWPAAVLGCYLKTGSRYEPPQWRGMSRLLERMAFKATQHRTAREIVARLEDMGGSAYSQGSREHMCYTAEALRTEIPAMFAIMADTVVSPAFLAEELEEQKVVLHREADVEEDTMEFDIVEDCLEIGFGGDGEACGLAARTILSHEEIDAITPEMLYAWHDAYFTPDRLVVAGAGIEHDTLVELTREHFGNFGSSSGRGHPPVIAAEPAAFTKWHGGVRVVEREITPKLHPGDPDVCHVAVAWQGPSTHDDDNIYASSVLQTLMGGGASFSSGGPGKGMYSHLYKNVLCSPFVNVERTHMFADMFEDTGVIGIYGSAPHQQASRLLTRLLREFIDVGKGSTLTETDVMRARNQLKKNLLVSLEARYALIDDIGRQILSYGYRHSMESVISEIEAVTLDSLRKHTLRMLQTPPVIIVHGVGVSQAISSEEIEDLYAQIRDIAEHTLGGEA